MTGAHPPPEAQDFDAHKLTVARLWAVERHPYLTSALFAMTVVPTEGLGRMAVDDRWRLYVDPEYVAGHSVALLGSVLVHQVGHLVRDHAGRSRAAGVDGSSRRDWATAADAEINDDLLASGLRLPEDRIVPEEQGWTRGRLAEEYFHAGRGPAGEDDEDEHHPDCGSGADGETRDWELSGEQSSGLPPSERRLVRAQVASDVLRHAKEGRGRLSGGWQRWAEDLLEPRVDWRRVLAAEVRKGVNQTTGRVDYTYRRPSRRAQACPGVILPAMEEPRPEIAVVCDTSGSMTDDLLAAVLAEVDGILRGLVRSRVRVLSVDATVQAVQRVATVRALDLIGGGGTDMGAGLEAAARLRPRPSAVVVLTDGLTPWPERPPGNLPVVVGLIGGLHARGAKAWAPPAWARTVAIDAADLGPPAGGGRRVPAGAGPGA